jgi:type I restriction enzyme S subunit
MSGAFVVYELNRDKIDAKFLEYFFKVPDHWKNIGSQSTGTNVRRQSLHPTQFEKAEIPLPPLAEQRRIVARIEELAAHIHEAQTLRQQAIQQVEAIFISKLRAVVKACGNSTRHLPFTSVATLERRPVEIIYDHQYREIGVYCFGKGIFHKQPRNGIDVGAKDLYIIRKGDLILQITFAWEGAVALAEEIDDGLYGSVRYLTFRVNEEICSPRYLLTYMKTPEAISALAKISPGSAGRNRVLSVKRLSEILVPIVPLNAQKWLNDSLQAEVNQLKALQAETAAELDALLPSILDRAFKGEL